MYRQLHTCDCDMATLLKTNPNDSFINDFLGAFRKIAKSDW
jgi:hypothetical protein